ncbi:g-protein coupled receptor 2-like protein [Leptotrombidium deliense]|uniref:G-protein coupled receptor 2-like protein n=1 Tax=Leptotrombidium deliense TaxID=299467 RepID=A0A443S6V5_9ACAR|nr:g-protein coupled receptor 2-like protein [Leptotrombidium deliense]
MPLIIILFSNAIFFTLTVINLKRTKKVTEVIRNKEDNIRLKLYLKLALIMGFTWIFAFIASFNGIDYLWYPFTILNGLQGVFIFMAFSLKKKNIESIRSTFMSTVIASVTKTNSTSL